MNLTETLIHLSTHGSRSTNQNALLVHLVSIYPKQVQAKDLTTLWRDRPVFSQVITKQLDGLCDRGFAISISADTNERVNARLYQATLQGVDVISKIFKS